MREEDVSTAQEIWQGGARTDRSNTWDGWIIRSRYGDSGSSWARLKRNCWLSLKSGKRWWLRGKGKVQQAEQGSLPMFPFTRVQNWRLRDCAKPWSRLCLTTCYLPRLWCWRVCRSTRAARWTARPCLSRNSPIRIIMKCRKEKWRKCWLASGGRCWEWDGWDGTTISLSWGEIPFS